MILIKKFVLEDGQTSRAAAVFGKYDYPVEYTHHRVIILNMDRQPAPVWSNEWGTIFGVQDQTENTKIF